MDLKKINSSTLPALLSIVSYFKCAEIFYEPELDKQR